MLRLRIDDRAFLGLIRKWLKAGVLDTDGAVIHSDTGTPQGGIVSPVLANVYLHYVLDLWFEKVVKAHCRGEVLLYRYADDWVCAFRFRDDAERFYRVLPRRLEKFGLRVAPEKTRILRFSRFHPSMKRRFTFLGFEFYWFEDREATLRVKRQHLAQEIAGRVPADQGMDQGESASAGKALFPGAQPQAAGALQLLWRTGQLPRALPLLRMGHELCVPVAQSARWKAPEFQLGDFYPGPRAHEGSAPPESLRLSAGGCLLDVRVCANASTTEEPGCGNTARRGLCGLRLESA